MNIAGLLAVLIPIGLFVFIIYNQKSKEVEDLREINRQDRKEHERILRMSEQTGIPAHLVKPPDVRDFLQNRFKTQRVAEEAYFKTHMEYHEAWTDYVKACNEEFGKERKWSGMTPKKEERLRDEHRSTWKAWADYYSNQ